MFVSWVSYHGRSKELADVLKIPAVFVAVEGERRSVLRKYWSYVSNTRQLLREQRPSVVVVMLPPAPALLSVLAFKPKNSLVIADLHTGFFANPKWSWFTKIGLTLLRNSSVIVTNRELADRCSAAGVDAFVIHDPVSVNTGELGNGGYVLCPLSYANDEPIAEIIVAANLLPQIKFVLTGRAPSSLTTQAPANVEFVGFVDSERFDHLMRWSSMVLALTTRDHTMQRAGYEALMSQKPQITSNFTVLREFLGEGATYVDPRDPAQIANAIGEIFADPAAFERCVTRVLNKRVEEQAGAIHELNLHIAAQISPQDGRAMAKPAAGVTNRTEPT